MRMRLLRRGWSARAILSSSCTLIAYAQFDSGSVVGTVHDADRRRRPGATVTLTNTDTGISLHENTTDAGQLRVLHRPRRASTS